MKIKITIGGENQLIFITLGLGILLLSFSAVLTKALMAEMEPSAIIFNRFWIASLAFAIYYFQGKIANRYPTEILKQEQLTVKTWLLLMAAGIFLAGTLITWAWSFDLTTVSHSCLLHYQNPIFTTLGAWLLFGQSFDRRFILGLILVIAGASIVTIEDLQWLQGTLSGDMLALLSGLFFSVELIIIGRIRHRVPTLTVTMGVCFFAALFSFPFAVFKTVSQGSSLFPISFSGWVLVISLGLVVQVLGHLLLYYSLKQVTSGFAAIALMLDISISSFLAWIIFAEQLTILDWLSLPIMFLGIYLAKSGQGAEKIEQFPEEIAIAN